MSIYAIQNKKTGKFVSSTDYVSGRFARDFKDSDAAVLFTWSFTAELVMHSRGCGEQYQVVEVKPLEVVEEWQH